MVLNGLEMASGSIRINRAELQTRVLDVIGIDPGRGRGALRLPAARAALRRAAARRHRARHRPHRDAARRHRQPARGRGLPEARRRRRSAHRRAGAAAGRDPRRARPHDRPAQAGSGAVRGQTPTCERSRAGLTPIVSKLRACASTPITRPPRPSATRPGRPCSRSCASTSATRRSRTGPGATRGAASTPRARARPARSASRRADVVFTGGASEADNIAILGRATRGPGRIVTTPLEHPAVSGAVEALERRGCEVVTLPVDADGRVPVSALDDGVQPGDLVCSLIWASNLTGVIQPVAEAAAICAERGVPLHLDAVQACPALEVDIGALPGAVTAAVAGHKLRRPEGRRAALRSRPRDARARALRRRAGACAATRHRERRAGRRPGRGADGRARRQRALRALPRRARRYEAALTRARARRDDRRRARRAHAGPLAGADRGPARPRARLAARRRRAWPRRPARPARARESSASPALTAMGVTPDAARGALRLSFGALSEDGHGVLAADAVARRAELLRARERGRLMLRPGDFELAGRVPEPDGRGLRGRQRVRRPRAHHDRARRRRRDRRRALRRGRLRARDRGRGLGLPPHRRAGRSSTPPARRSPTARAELGLERSRARVRRGRARRPARRARRRRRARARAPARPRAQRRRDVGRRRLRRRAAARARAGGGEVVGLTLRLWIDEQAPDAERACCSPAAVLRARESCHALGLPHVTLDGREAFRARRRRPVRGGLRARRDAEPVHDLQRLLPPRGARRRRRAASARAHVATGHYARLVERDGRTLVGARRRRGQGSVVHARARAAGGAGAAAPAARRRHQGRRARRGGRRRHGRRDARARARTSASSAAARSTTSSRAQGVQLAAGQHPRRGRAASSAATPAPSPTRRASAAGSASPPPRRSTCCARMRAATSSSWGRGAGSPCSDVAAARRAPATSGDEPRAREAARPLAHGRARASSRCPEASRLRLDEPVYGGRRGPDGGALRRGRMRRRIGRDRARFAARPSHLLSRICASRQGEILKFRPTPADERPEGAIRRTVIPGQEKTETWPFPHSSSLKKSPSSPLRTCVSWARTTRSSRRRPRARSTCSTSPTPRPSTTRRSGEAPPSTCSAPTCARSATARCSPPSRSASSPASRTWATRWPSAA